MAQDVNFTPFYEDIVLSCHRQATKNGSCILLSTRPFIYFFISPIRPLLTTKGLLMCRQRWSWVSTISYSKCNLSGKDLSNPSC